MASVATKTAITDEASGVTEPSCSADGETSGSADMERGYAKQRKFPNGNSIVRCMSCGNFKTSYSNLAIWQIALQCRLCDSWICSHCVENDGDDMDKTTFRIYSHCVYMEDSKFLCWICSETSAPNWKKQRRAARNSSAWKHTLAKERVQVGPGVIEGVVSLKCHRFWCAIPDPREPSWYCMKHLIFETGKCLEDQWDILRESFYIYRGEVKAYLVPSAYNSQTEADILNRCKSEAFRIALFESCGVKDIKGAHNLFAQETGSNIGRPTGILAKKCVGEIAGHYDIYILNRMKAHHE